MRLKGKRAFISGAGQGIGRETALQFAREGADVHATDINPKSLADLEQADNSIRTSILDVTDAAAVSALLGSQSAFDVVFNCAGYVANGTIQDCDPEDWRRSFQINVDSMYFVCKAVLPAMLENGGGAIINMASVASSVLGAPDRFAYGTSKAAVIGLTKSIAVDYVKDGIRCNAICPGTVQSPSLDERLRATGDYESARAAFIARQPMGRIGDPKEIAELATYLASDGAKFTTGQIHVIDGGWST
ncbi:MAG: SDR family oxidoreductase [Sphingobium sp.]|jgi:2-keto-3-deoxy-L-fuconate dehydrogenase|nr:SDR family oxidoreductase [Sphingobium sp.]